MSTTSASSVAALLGASSFFLATTQVQVAKASFTMTLWTDDQCTVGIIPLFNPPLPMQTHHCLDFHGHDQSFKVTCTPEAAQIHIHVAPNCTGFALPMPLTMDHCHPNPIPMDLIENALPDIDHGIPIPDQLWIIASGCTDTPEPTLPPPPTAMEVAPTDRGAGGADGSGTTKTTTGGATTVGDGINSAGDASEGLGIGLIIGIVLGALCCIALLAGLVFFLMRRGKGERKGRSAHAHNPGQDKLLEMNGDEVELHTMTEEQEENVLQAGAGEEENVQAAAYY